MSRALLIGVADYSGAGLEDLPSAVHDVNRLTLALETHRDGASLNFDVTSRIISEPGDAWGAHDLVDQVDQLIDGSDHFLFYFSGHGVSSKFGLQLATPEKRQSLDSGVYFDALLHRFNAAEAEVTIILDCCFAGMAGDRTLREPSQSLRLTHLRDGVTILASSGRNEDSQYAEEGPSAFTEQILACLESEEQPAVDVIDLYDYSRKNLQGQTPVLRTFGSRFSAVRARDLDTMREVGL